MMKRIVFMGTPEIAACILQGLLDAGYPVAAAVTQPDKPKGRGKEVAASPVKELCRKYEIPVLQPERARDPEFLNTLREIAPDLIVVAAYKKLLPKEVLELPEYGCINVHTSLLPDYRGASPIQWVILNGEKKTGVTIMHMDEGCDTGDIICSRELDLSPEETADSLHDKLAVLGRDLLLEAVKSMENHTAERHPQDLQAGCYVKTIDKSLGNLDFTRPAAELERYVRGLNPWPCAYTFLNGKLLKFWKVRVCAAERSTITGRMDVTDDGTTIAEPGTVTAISKTSFTIAAGEDSLEVLELQMEGKRRMSCEEFLRGYPLTVGTKLGERNL